MKNIFLLLFLLATVTSCGKKKAKKQAKEDDAIITAYISSHHLDATKTDSGLYYVIDTLGTGDYPNSSSDVQVAYKGYFTDGNIFDKSAADGIVFNLQGVISGWTEGIPYFKEGGSGILLIPSHLGYGASPRQGIPANSVLIFDIKLLDVK